MKILHLTAVRELTQGQRKQLSYEYQASKTLSLKWDTIALHTSSPQTPFEKQFPFLFRMLFLRSLYAWWLLLRVKNKYDIVLQRHMQFDPFVMLFGWFIHNRISIHHAKEIEELTLTRKNWKGKFASSLEKVTGWFNIRQVAGILGVTQEIASYQILTHGLEKPTGVYPNGINFEQVSILPDQRGSEIEIAFVCGKFSEWHGLDRLIDLLLANTNLIQSYSMRIHIIGHMSELQLTTVDELNCSIRRKVIETHGHINNDKYYKTLAKCDIGLTSLALDRKSLAEASTLKVREYLALGIPVYSNHSDSALPDDYRFYRKGPLNLNAIVNYATEMKDVSRSSVRSSSVQYIEKREIMEEVANWISGSFL